MLKLYYAPGACSLVAHVALEETGAPFETMRINLAGGEQRLPAYLAVNPRGRVPTLITDTGVVLENIAILSYIAMRFRDARLLPFQDLAQMARAYELMSWFASGVQVSFSQIFRSERFTDDEEAKSHLKEDGRKRCATAFGEIDGIAASGRWMLGDTYSVLDPFALVLWRWGQRIGLDASAYPAFFAHTEDVLRRPAVVRVLERESAQAANG